MSPYWSIIVLFCFIALIGYIIMKMLYNFLFLLCMKKLAGFYEFNYPIWLKKVFEGAMDLAFICIIVASGFDLVTDVIKKIVPDRAVHQIFYDMAIVIATTTIALMIIYAFLKSIIDGFKKNFES